MPNTTKVEPNPENLMMQRLDEIEKGLQVQLETKDTQIKELVDKVNTLSQSGNKRSADDNIVDTARRSANNIDLPVIDGVPIVKGEVVSAVGVKGVDFLMMATDVNGVVHSIPFGCDIKRVDFSDKSAKDIHRTSFENLKTANFDFVDIDENDLTGASKVEKGVIVDDGVTIAEIDRSSGTPIPTGRRIRASVKEDIRHYTMVFEGKKFTLTNKELGNIRI